MWIQFCVINSEKSSIKWEQWAEETMSWSNLSLLYVHYFLLSLTVWENKYRNTETNTSFLYFSWDYTLLYFHSYWKIEMKWDERKRKPENCSWMMFGSYLAYLTVSYITAIIALIHATFSHISHQQYLM